MLYLVLALVALGFVSAILGLLSHHKGGEEEPLQEGVSCNTCNGENTKCEQECMMEAATKDIVYYDDEELDRFKSRQQLQRRRSGRICRSSLYHASPRCGWMEQKSDSQRHQPSQPTER